MKTHVIHWKSRATGRSGTGTRLLEKDEASRLAEKLNRDYPSIFHEVIGVASEMAVTPAASLIGCGGDARAET